MGVMIAIGVIAASIIGAAISQLLAEEFKAWVPTIADHMIRFAVSRVPPQLRKRLNEEWHSHIDEIPGTITKLVVAFGFVFASRSIRPLPVAVRRAKAGATGLSFLQDSLRIAIAPVIKFESAVSLFEIGVTGILALMGLAQFVLRMLF